MGHRLGGQEPPPDAPELRGFAAVAQGAICLIPTPGEKGSVQVQAARWSGSRQQRVLRLAAGDSAGP